MEKNRENAKITVKKIKTAITIDAIAAVLSEL